MINMKIKYSNVMVYNNSNYLASHGLAEALRRHAALDEGLLYCTVLYCTVLYYTILYCTVRYYTILYYTILFTILYDTILYCIII